MKKTVCLAFGAIFLSSIALLLSVTAFSQPTPNPLYSHLPPSANHIYSIKVGQIIAKGNLTSVLAAVPPMKDPNAAMALDIIKDPASAGIDLDHEILIAQTTATGNGADTLNFTEILVPLTDSAKLRTTLTGAIKGLHIHRLPGKGASAYVKKEGMAWNDRVFVLTETSPVKNVLGSAHSRPPAAAHRPVSELALEKSIATLTGYSATPWLTDQRFITGFATEEDIHAWSSKMDFSQTIAKLIRKMAAKNPAMKGKPIPDFGKMDQMPHPPVLSTFNFEDGRILFRMTSFNQPDNAAIYQRIFDHPINKDLLARVPHDGLLLGFVASRFNPAGLPDLLDKMHVRKMLDSALAKKGLTIDDISSIFGGDILVAALGDTTTTTDTAKKKINFYFVATLGDPSKLMQLAAKLASNNGNLPDTAKIGMFKKLTDKMVIKDNMVVISNSKEMAEKYFSNTERRSTDLIDDDRSVHTVVVDLKAVSAWLSATKSSDPKAMVFARILEKLDKIELSSTMPQGNTTVTTLKIVTGDQSTNSLKTLVGIMH